MNSFQKYLSLLLVMLLLVSNGFAQITAADEKAEAAIRADLEVLSKKIGDAFNQDPKLRDEMNKRLQEIYVIKDSVKLMLAVNSYRSAYQAAYGDKVKEAGVDLADFIKQMTAKYPNYTFALQNTYGISYKKKKSPPSTKSGTAPSTPTTTTTPITGFLQSKDASCALGSGSSVTFPTRSVKVSTTAAVAGGCTADGALQKLLTLPASATSIFLRLIWTQKINGHAVGVVGTARASTYTHVTASIAEDNRFVISEFDGEVVHAFILWVANFDRETQYDESLDLTAFKGKTLKLRFDDYSNAISAICCATGSTAQISYSKADLIVTQ
jgi:hypothetical protein